MPNDQDLNGTSSSWPPGSSSPHASPLLVALEPSDLPMPSPVCVDCPAALWYATPLGLRCYCNTFRMIAWGAEEFDPNRDPVMACDGREQAIAALREAMEKGD